ncbi:MAG: hypothetical protein ACPGQS_03895, partial [Bradymonadia bacterium]
HGTFSIDKPLKTFGRIGDRARFQGQYFSDKAPGTGLMGSVIYRIAKFIHGDEEWTMAELLRLFRRGLVLPFALMGFIWLRRSLALYRIPVFAVEWVSWSWLLGSVAFHYSGAFFGHQIAASLLIGSLFYLKRAALNSSATGILMSGLLSGAAVMTEYPAAIGVFFIGVYGLLNRTLWNRQIVQWCVGGLPFAILLGFYHQRCFGHPLSLPYEHLAAATYRKIHGAGIAGVTGPEFKAFQLWFLSLRRGLLSSSPFFLLSVFGVLQQWKIDRGSAVAYSLLITATVLFASSAHIWGGDWGYGPRIIVFIIGLLSIPVAFGVQALRDRPVLLTIAFTLMLYGILNHQFVHFIFPEPWAKFSNPVADLLITVREQALFSPNLASVYLGIHGVWSASPLLILLVPCFILLFRQSGTRANWVIPAASLLALAAFWYVASHTDTSASHHQKWTELLELWSSREHQYH